MKLPMAAAGTYEESALYQLDDFFDCHQSAR
jgi:hypothetical protein